MVFNGRLAIFSGDQRRVNCHLVSRDGHLVREEVCLAIRDLHLTPLAVHFGIFRLHLTPLVVHFGIFRLHLTLSGAHQATGEEWLRRLPGGIAILR